MIDGRNSEFIQFSGAWERRSVTWRDADVRSRRRSAYPKFKIGAVYTKALE